MARDVQDENIYERKTKVIQQPISSNATYRVVLSKNKPL